METVNFQCGHCRQLLAVSKQHLGQQVRCPHCQQVVVAPSQEPAAPPPAPAAAPASAPAPDPFGSAFSFTPPRPEEHDSIFSAPAESDDLFGPAPSGRVEMPPDFRPAPAPPPPWQNPAPPPPQQPIPDLQLASSPPLPGPNDSTLPFVDGPAHPAVSVPAAETIQPAAEQAPAPFPGMGGMEGEGGTDLASAFTPVRPRVSGGWHIALFIIPLISYSVLVSVAAGILFFRLQAHKTAVEGGAMPVDLEMIPDVIGDHPTQQKDDKHTEFSIPRRTGPLPARLKIGLGQTLRLGELEVTATAVKRGRVEVKEEGKNPYTPEPKALKLYLKLKNVSSDLAFYPMDNFFTRATDKNGHAKNDGRQMLYPPYTQLVIAGHRFYGGPAAYDWPGGGKNREYVVGTDYDTQLKPGEEMTTFVCTDPEDREIDQQLAKHKGEKLLWRVQVRRGSMMFKGHRKPVCAVFGVEFTDADIAP